MQKDDKRKVGNTHFKDVSRFNRWVSQLDDKDKSLAPLARKSKWVLTIAALLLVFGASFFLSPAKMVTHKNLIAPQKTPAQPNGQRAMEFDMPVDSFENRLKLEIDENLPEKE